MCQPTPKQQKYIVSACYAVGSMLEGDQEGNLNERQGNYHNATVG